MNLKVNENQLKMSEGKEVCFLFFLQRNMETFKTDLQKMKQRVSRKRQQINKCWKGKENW